MCGPCISLTYTLIGQLRDLRGWRRQPTVMELEGVFAVLLFLNIGVARGAWEGGTRERESGFGDER